MGLISWVRLLSKYTIVKTQGWWNEATLVDQHWAQQMPENG